jgi:hypothetical protein
MNTTRREGGCHCGRVRYRVAIDLATPTLRCNCSICTKSRAWIVPVPAKAFVLLSGQTGLGDYRFGAREVAHHFCPDCGVRTHGSSTCGGDDAWVAICVATLDLAPTELASLPIVYRDGHADIDTPPAVTTYL